MKSTPEDSLHFINRNKGMYGNTREYTQLGNDNIAGNSRSRLWQVDLILVQECISQYSLGIVTDE